MVTDDVPCGNQRPHGRHEWIDRVTRRDCPGVSALSAPSITELTDEQQEDRDVLDRILARGDLTLIGLPVKDIADIYTIVQEWRVMGGEERLIEDLRRRTRLRAALEWLLDVAERARGGDPSLPAEEWHAARDYARKVLNEIA